MRFGPRLRKIAALRTRQALPFGWGESLLAIVCLFGFAAAARAEQNPTFDSLLSQVKADGCTSSDDVDLLIFTCEKDQSLWYFTKPGHPAHPGVIKRFVTQDGQGVNISERGWSFASDTAQPAFVTFLAQIRATDQLMKDEMAAQQRSAPILDPSIRIYGNWQPQGTESDAVVSLTRYYFSLEDSGRYEEARALFDPSLASMLSLSQYRDIAAHTVSSGGNVKTRTIKTIDWEKDSPLGPPGIYAALDYEADTTKGQLCGFVAWRKAPDGFFTLAREETNILPSTLSAAELASLKAKFHCVG